MKPLLASSATDASDLGTPALATRRSSPDRSSCLFKTAAVAALRPRTATRPRYPPPPASIHPSIPRLDVARPACPNSHHKPVSADDRCWLVVIRRAAPLRLRPAGSGDAVRAGTVLLRVPYGSSVNVTYET